jgi:tetratricopeptide (TPR) repeat protein
VFYLAAMLTCLRFDRTRSRWAYGWALLLFVLALLSKTVTITLPAALLVVFWWKRGRLSWKSDVLPVLPLFVFAIAAGLVTVLVERAFGGARGPDFALAPVERGLVAGRAIWFYLGKLFWPADLVFIYPRWHVDQSALWQYLFPLAAVALLLALWLWRRRARAPLAAVLFFAGTLFPMLGFLSQYFFLYSFVADHFQYLANLGIIALVSAGIALGLEHWRLWRRPVGYAVCLVILATLATLTWHQSRTYADAETLYRTALGVNPGCWVAENNLGNVLAGRGQVEEAIVDYRAALAIKHDYAEAAVNLANALSRQGQFEEAVTLYQKALEINPALAQTHYDFAVALAGRGKLDQAVIQYQKALEIRPDYAKAHNNLGAILWQQGRMPEAIVQFRKALEAQPDYADAQRNLQAALALQR